jgi:hypothetical protein
VSTFSGKHTGSAIAFTFQRLFGHIGVVNLPHVLSNKYGRFFEEEHYE